jgi:SAM-dependent methyltransferase
MTGLRDYYDIFRKRGLNRLIDQITQNRLFDLWHGTDTETWMPKEEMSEELPNYAHGKLYQPSYTKQVVSSLRRVAQMVDPKKTTFIDLGCGKGKVLFLAKMKFPFKKVVGIEYCEDIYKVACRNLDKLKLKDTHILLGDAAQFNEYEDDCIVYIYNSFDEKIAQKVRENIEAKIKNCILIYNNPIHEEVFEGWDKVSINKRWHENWTTNIYRWSRPVVSQGLTATP